MLAVDNNNTIYLTRGDSCTLNLEIDDAEGNDYDYSSDVVVFTMKQNPNDKAAIISKTFANGKISISPSETEGLQFGQYYYDVQLTHDEDGTVDTVIPCSIINIMAEVTW